MAGLRLIGRNPSLAESGRSQAYCTADFRELVVRAAHAGFQVFLSNRTDVWQKVGRY